MTKETLPHDGSCKGYCGYCNLWGHMRKDCNKRKKAEGINSADWNAGTNPDLDEAWNPVW